MTAPFENEMAMFPTGFGEIIRRIGQIDPVGYGKTRNFTDGAVTYLSPYISRGVISTKQVLSGLLNKGYRPNTIEKFIQELAWRDYWQQVWIAKGTSIDSDLKQPQTPIANMGIPKAILGASTGINAIDFAIDRFYRTGYLHNHVRMYLASITCNISQSHWRLPAQWMYYHLLDGDWASNALSWQWVAGSNSHKKYYADQDNINKFCHTRQKGTFLDVPYGEFGSFPIPEILKETLVPKFRTPLPSPTHITIVDELPTLIYNSYNLDPLWKKEECVNRILLLEPSHFENYPVSQKTIDFILALSKNVEDIQIYVGEFDTLVKTYHLKEVHFKEHPLNSHYRGLEGARDWMFGTRGYYPSFFPFWKKCRKELAF